MIHRYFPVALVLASTVGCHPSESSPIPEARADEPAGAAVVELFTSEGCSSCPPADAVLADIARDARQSGRPIYAVAFHVDYWDELGWADRFASPDFTNRQRQYGSAFGRHDIYTPQMIVNGEEEFVGSDRAHADSSILRALAQRATASVSLHAHSNGPDAVAVDYSVRGAKVGALLDIVVLDRAASVAVTAGENAHKTLHHTDIARALATIDLTHPVGTRVVHVPANAVRDGGVIAFVREPGDSASRMRVVGAGHATIDPAS